MAEIKYLSKSGLETLAEILATKSWVEGKNYTTATGHNHDDRYYTENEINTKLAGKANADHDHRLLTSLVPQGTSIPAGADLNTIPYIKVGKYYCSTNANADDIINCPVSSAFMMEVYSPLSTTIDNESTSAYVYRIRRITHYSTGVQYVQCISSGKTAGQFTYGNWRAVPLAPFTLSATNSSSGATNNGGSSAVGSATKGVYVKSDGTLAAMTYTLGKSVPSDAVFTDTNTKVTNVGNHYTPEANTASALSADASSTVAATWGTTSLVTGVNLQRDAAGHVTGITLDSIKMPANPNTNVPLTDSYSGTSTTTALSQKGANSLYTTLNNKFGSYLPLAGGTLKGNLTMMPSNQHNADQFILFKYSTTDLDDYSWRLGYLGTGSGNENYFAIQNNGVGDTWTSVLYFGLTNQIAYFKNTPKVGTTNVSLEGHVHAASAITSGTLADARIPSLAASKITSGVFNVARIPDMGAGKITSGTFSADRIPNLAASKITSGTFATDRIPNLAASKITSGTFADARIPNLAASKITSGTFDTARIPALNYLSLDGGTLKGPTFNSVLCTGDNLAVYTTQTSTVTGTIKIKLPFAFISSMMMFEIYIYDYSTTNGSKIYVSGYNYGTNSTYNNYGCTIIGKYNKKVRLSYDGTNCCILLGNVDSTWNYPQVILKSAFGGFTGKVNIPQTGYEISVITSETNYTKTVECTNYLKATTVAWADITNKPTAFSPTGHTHSAADINSGTLSANRIPNLSAAKITSGVLGIDRTPKITGHGTCSTAASTAAKVVTIADTTWTLKVGSIIGVKFSNSNSASGVTLNVNNTGAKSIYYNNEAYTSSSTSICGYKNRTTYYMYDGTYWVWLSMSYLDGNTDTKVRQYTTDNTNSDYSILFRYSTSAPSSSYEANYSRYDSGITVNPSTNTITATNFKGNASSATISRYIQCPDTRSTAIVPSEVSATSSGVAFDFKSKEVTGLDSAYSGVMTFRPYSSSSDWSGGPIHQLAFDGNGLHHRTASSDTWNAWKSISYTDHTHNYAPASHNHDGRYYTESEIDTKLAGKANSSHGTHVPGIKSATAVSTLGWSTNSNYVPDLSMLAYWNGAYIGTSSNLAYSANGTIIGSSNYTTYTVKKDGTGASGTWGINVTGNAGTATKLATARTFNLSTGVTATAQSFDGSGNVVIPVTGIKESYLTWGGQNFSGSYGPIDAAMIPQLGANRFAFMPAESITVEYSINGGGKWSTYSVNNDNKINLFNGNGTALYIGASSATKIDKSKYMLRITIATSAASVYTVLNKFIIYCSTSGSSGAYCTIDARLQSNYTAGTNTWVTFADKVPISGWSGYNVINTNGLTTFGNTAGSQYGQVRFTFGVTSHASSVTYPGLTINKIFGFGGVGWTTPSTMASTGQMYTYDASKNVTFPAKVTATTFAGSLTGNASTATTATTATKLDSNAGSAVKPIYFTGGKPTECTYSLNKTVPSNAVFTDTALGKTFKTGITTATNSGWDNTTNQDKIIPTMNFIAYWNGAYNSSSSSNLTYCNKGAFGTAATYNATTSIKDGSNALITSGAVYTGLAGKANSSHSHSYIPLAGGTLEKNSSQIQRSGSSTSWYLGRSNAMIKINSYSGYNAIASMKTTDGDWSMGVYTGNKLYFSYVKDTDFNNNNNATTAQIALNPDGSITGNLSGNASTATKLATARTLKIGSTGKTFDGSGNVSWTLAEIGAAAASHGTHVTDGAQTWSGNKTFNNQIILGSLNSSTSSSSNSQIVFGTSGAKLTSNGTGNIIMNPNSGTTGQIIFNPGADPYIKVNGTKVSLVGHTHSSILDSGNSTTTTFAYSKSALNYADYNWLAGWNGYELRAVNKSQFATASHAHKSLAHDDTTTFGTYSMQYKQLSGDFDGNTGWCHYLTFNHGDGATYYHYNVGFPFWSVPIYKRQIGSTSDVTEWYKFITEENYTAFCAPASHTHDDRYYTETEINTKLAGKSDTGHTHSYLPLSGGTLTGNLIISKATSATMTYDSTNPSIEFSENGSQPVKILYTDYDNYRSPAGLKVIGSQGNEWLEVDGTCYANKFITKAGTEVSYSGHNHNSSYYTKTEVDTKLAGKAASSHSHSYVPYGTVVFTPANTELTSANVLSLTGGWSMKKGTWDYSGNGYIKAGAFGNIDLAGTSILTFGSSSAYTQLFITAPTQSGHSGITNEMLFYNNHGSDYSPGWTRVLTNRNYNSYAPKKDGTGATGTWGINITGSAGSVAWNNVTGKPSTFSPSAHNHPYLPTAGGTMTGNITFDDNRSIRWHASDSYSISCPKTSTAAYMLIKGFEGTTINKRLSVYNTATSAPNTSYNLYTDGSLYASSAVIGGSTTIANGSDLTLKASSSSATDPGDLVFANSSGTELGRIWLNGSNFSLRYGSSDPAKTILTNANIGTYALTSLPSHTHDDRYYTESEIDTKLAGKSDTSHTHSYLPTTSSMLKGYGGSLAGYHGENGWHRIAEVNAGSYGYGSYLLYLCGSWNHSANTTAILAIDTTHTNARITQLSGYLGFINKIRLVNVSSNKYYVDININYSDNPNHASDTPGSVYYYFLTNGNVEVTTSATKITETVTASAELTLRDGGFAHYATTAGSAPASDVYSWAKAASKPSYNFGEIGAGVATIGDGSNRIMFRTNASYKNGIYYSTPGNEALVFGTVNPITSWIFATTDPTSQTAWTSLTPSLQIKNGKVAINKLIASGVEATYNLEVNGNINASNGFFDTSDERLKDFYDDIDVDFDKLKAIPKKYFSWKNDENKEIHLGTSAQEIQKVYPEIVNESADGELSVDYSKLSVVALAAVDKLYDKINKIEQALIDKGIL